MLRLSAKILAVSIASMLVGACDQDESTPDDAPTPTSGEVTVNASAGPIVGKVDGKVQRFLGIPYAEPPVGARRWTSPKALEPWTTPLRAFQFGSVCAQIATAVGIFPLMNGEIAGEEDCLFLNVYAPTGSKADAKLPVMVWIHGGGLLFGAGSDYDGSVLARDNDVIVVTLNYRLSTLGFLAHGALADEANGQTGNYGLQDQQLALKWVQDNIGAFGGDPKNVTIFGESAGASSVCYHLASPAANGLFHKAIMESEPACIRRNYALSLEEGKTAGKAFSISDEIQCGDDATTLSCLRNRPPKDLLYAPSQRYGINGDSTWGSVYGDEVLPTDPPLAIAQGDINRVPVMAGSNHDEGQLFVFGFYLAGIAPSSADAWSQFLAGNLKEDFTKVLTEYPPDSFEQPERAYTDPLTDERFACSSLRLQDALSQHTTSYTYELNDPDAGFSLQEEAAKLAPDLHMGSFHTAEIGYIFRTKAATSDPTHFTPAQDELSQNMVGYWVNFAKTGDPNGGSLPTWTPYTAAKPYVQSLKPEGIGPNDMFAAENHCAFWADLENQ